MYKGQVFKSLELDDYIITPFFAYKEWNWTSNAIDSGSIQFLYGEYDNSSVTSLISEPTNSNGMWKRSVYDVINHLYYANSTNPHETFSDWYSGNVNFDLKSEIVYIGIPNMKFGDTIKEGSFSLTSGDYTITDDSYGNLISGSEEEHIGNIFYKTGDIVFTNTSSLAYTEISESNFDTLSYKGKVKITEHTTFCYANRGELTMTQNSTAYSGSVVNDTIVSGSGLPLNTILSSSEWDPYITTVGLYDDNYNLLVVAKLAKPVINDKNMDLSFTIKFDT